MRRALWWYELPDGGEARGPALTDALLAEEAEHGVTEDVAWAYAEAMPALLGPDPMVELQPLAFGRGAMRAVALETPVELEGLLHVQTASPEVCRRLGSRVPSFTVRGEACVRALLEHGSAVREVAALDCPTLSVDAPFRLSLPDAFSARWFRSHLAEQFLPIVRLDLDVWLCWDRDLARPCVVREHDAVIEGRWGPRDVIPEASPPPWAEPDALAVGGEGWAATMIDDHRRGRSSVLADPQRGWCRLHVEDGPAYGAALAEAWRAGRAPPSSDGPGTGIAWLASLRVDGARAYVAWIGHQRVLRLRRRTLEQLTVDHDLAYDALHGGVPFPPELVAQLGGVPDVVSRSLPTHPLAEGSCDVAEGDRFLLLDKSGQRDLEVAAGGSDAFAARAAAGTPRDVARWMRDVLLAADRERAVVVVDAGATIERRATTPSAQPRPVTARDLLERPADFHGRQVRFRGVYRTGPEVSSIADAWFSGEVRSATGGPCPWGAWIAEAEGIFLHDGTGRGHFDGYRSELQGTLTVIDPPLARPVAPDRVRFARKFVLLSSEISIERGLTHWFHDRRRVLRLGDDARLPVSGAPERCRVRATFYVGTYGHLFLRDWEILHVEPRAPEPVTIATLGAIGRYVELEGVLSPTDRYLKLDGSLDVTPPSVTRDPELRHVLLGIEPVARARALLGAGRRVVVRGEVASGPHLYAFEVLDGGERLEL